MAFVQNTIDSLFEEDIPSNLYLLPAEMRNAIMKQVIFDGAESLTIKINDTGKIILPPIIMVSKQIHNETYGYLATAFQNPATKFEAKVRDYDPKPLLATLERIAQQTGIKRADLVARCHVHFIEEPRVHIGNLLAWIQGNINDPAVHPIFPSKTIDIPGFAHQSVFSGRISLKHILSTYEPFEKRNQLALWNKCAINFLQTLEIRELNLNGRAMEGAWWFQSGVQIKKAVVREFAEWHDIFLNKERIQWRYIDSRERMRVERDHVYVAQAMEDFALCLEQEMRLWPQ